MASDSEHSDSDLSDDEIDEIDPISPSSGLTEVDKSHFNNDCTLSDALRRCFATTGRQGTIESDIHLGVNDGDPDFNMAWSSPSSLLSIIAARSPGPPPSPSAVYPKITPCPPGTAYSVCSPHWRRLASASLQWASIRNTPSFARVSPSFPAHSWHPGSSMNLPLARRVFFMDLSE